MIEEEGIVVKTTGASALIKTRQSSACESCSSKKSCASGGEGSDDEAFIEADNTIGANVGDRVIFTVGTGSVLKAGALLYLVPILSFILGVVIGQSGAVTALLPGQNPDLLSGVLGGIFLALAFIGLKVYSAFLDKGNTFRPKVLRVE